MKANQMTFSDEQIAIFAWGKSGTGNLVVEAFAGTGKTTTIKAMFEHCPEQRILYAVFNKRNQMEAGAKITDPRVDVRTLHSLGFKFIKQVWRDAKPDDEVEVDRATKISPHFASDSGKESLAALLKLVGFAKNTFISPTEDNLAGLCEAQDIDCMEGVRVLCGWALKHLAEAKIKDAQGRISFNDMVWLPVAMNWVRKSYQLVVVDETQDMNMPQLMMARGASSGRIACVGDSRQAIYSFRGAASDGMGMMKIQLRAQVLKLSTTYRCPKTVVNLAAEIVPDYKAAEFAPDGEVSPCPNVLASVQIGDVILSRLNAPLMPLALQLLRKNIPARIEGRDIGKQIIGMVRSMKAKSVPHFIERVEGWLAKQIERLQKSKNAEKKIEATRDIAETLKALAQDATSVADIELRVNNLFQDSDSNSKPAVVLSSVHKAKGLEWGRVFMLTETFRRGRGMEEDNIFYVAVTRAMKSLFLVGGNGTSASPVPPPALAIRQPENPLGKNCQVATLPQKDLQVADNQGAKNRPLAVVELPHGFDSSKLQPCPVLFDNTNLNPGERMRKVGELITHQGGARFVVTRVSDSSAVCEAFGRKTVTITDKFTDEQRSFERQDNRMIRISPKCDASEAPVMMDDFNNFISRKSGGNGVNQQTGNDETSMPKKNNKKAAGSKAGGETNYTPVSYSGRAALVAKLVADGKTDEQIHETVKAKLAGYNRFNVQKTIDGKRKKAKAAAGKPESKSAAKAKPKAKGGKKKTTGKDTPPPPAAPAMPPPPAPPVETPEPNVE